MVQWLTGDTATVIGRLGTTGALVVIAFWLVYSQTVGFNQYQREAVSAFQYFETAFEKVEHALDRQERLLLQICLSNTKDPDKCLEAFR